MAAFNPPTPTADEPPWRAWEPLLARLAVGVARMGGEAWLVGGCLRDMALRSLSAAPSPSVNPPSGASLPLIGWRDVDVAVTGDPLLLARALADDLRAVVLADTPSATLPGMAPGVVRHSVAIAPLREQTVRLHIGAPLLPAQAQLDLSRLEGASIEADLAQRDFRINALALPLTTFLPLDSSLTNPTIRTGADDALSSPATGAAQPVSVAGAQASAAAGGGPLRGDAGWPVLANLLDPLGAVADLRARRLQVASPHALTDDPGRILRGARLLAGLGLTATDETMRLARTAAPLLVTLPADRVRDELRGVMAQPQTPIALAFLADVGAFQTLLPTLWQALHSDEEAATDARNDARNDARDADALGDGWALALAALALTDAFQIAPPGAASVAAAPAPFGGSALLADWYAQPLADGAPRALALRWGVLLAACSWRERLRTGAEPATESASSLPEAPGQAERTLALALPITREERRIAAGVALTSTQAYCLLTQAATLDDERVLDAIPTRRFFAAHGAVGVDALVAAALLTYAERARVGSPTMVAATPAPTESAADVVALRARRLAEVYLAAPERIVPPPLLDGGDLIHALGVAPGPLVGAALAAVRAAQIDGQVTNPAEALAWAAAYLAQQGQPTTLAATPRPADAPPTSHSDPSP